MTKREKWMLHKLEFQRMLRGYEASGKPIRHLRPGGGTYSEPKEEEEEEEEDDAQLHGHR